MNSSKKIIYIVGGNGFARECFFNLQQVMQNDKNITFGGFMGHGGYGKTVDYKTCQNLYVGEVSEHKFKDNEYVIIGAGYPSLRLKIYNELKAQNIKFFNLVTYSITTPDIKMGEGNVILNSVITANVEIGNANVFNGQVIVGHDCMIGNFNFFGPRSQVLGNVKVKNMNQIGANAILLPNAKIGSNNKIAPLSAVYKGCKDNCYMMGNPALKIGNVE